MAPDGRCKFGDARGRRLRAQRRRRRSCVLKPLSRALADGDRVYAVIRGSAVNNDGRSSGVHGHARAGVGQEEMLRARLRRRRRVTRRGSATSRRTAPARAPATRWSSARSARCSARAARPARRCLRRLGQDQHRPHRGRGRHRRADQGRAGAAARRDPGQPALRDAEPRHPLGRAAASTMPTRHEPVAGRPTGRGVAGVSAFGIAGTNAHVVLEEAPPARRRARRGRHVARRCCCRSAAEPTGAARARRALRRRCSSAADAPVARTTSAGSAATPRARRSSTAPRSSPTIATELVARAARASSPARTAAAQGVADRGAASAIGVRLPGPGGAVARDGAGSCWPSEPVFRDALRALRRRAPGRCVDWSLLEQLLADPACRGVPARRDRRHPAGAVRARDRLAALWRRWGIEPDAVVGHSMGEVGARPTWPARSTSTRRCASSAGAAR